MLSLRPYQARGKRDIFKTWDIDDIIFFQLATGGGKTVIFTEVIMDYLLKGLRVMLIAHREELISQAWKTLYKANIYAGIIQGDTPTNYSLPAQVCSIQTIARRKNLPHADLIVIDEGHHVTDDNSYGKILQRYPHAKVLIVSATPYRLSGEGFQNIVPGKVAKLITNSTNNDLIKDGWLVPLRVFASYVPDTSQVDTTRGEWDEQQAVKAMELAPIVESYQEHARGMQGLCFAQNVAHSIDITRKYWQAGIPAEHLDANSKPEQRQKVISDFNAGLVKVVSNVGLFTEGTDFPNCQFVQLAAMTKSLSKYLQMVGRGTRPVPGLVDPIPTSEARRAAIAASIKPECIILDNAGLWKEHFLPDFPHDWDAYFVGTKRAKGEKKPAPDEIEMLVYVAEDENGKRHRTHNAKEIEGMQLVEITKEVRRKLVNVKAVAEFDRLLKLNASSYSQKYPGQRTVSQYLAYCSKFDILVVTELWDYMRRKLIEEPKAKEADMFRNRERAPDAYPANLFMEALQRIARVSVTDQWLLEEKAKYYRRNHSQMVMHAQDKEAQQNAAKSYLKL